MVNNHDSAPLKAVYSVSGDSTSRYVVDGVLVTADPNIVAATATNGKAFAVRVLGIGCKDQKPVATIVDGVQIKALRTSGANKDQLSVNGRVGFVNAATGLDVAGMPAQYDGRNAVFPPFADVAPQPDSITCAVRVNAESLGNLLRAVHAKGGEDPSVMIAFGAPNKPLYVLGNVGSAVIMPVYPENGGTGRWWEDRVAAAIRLFKQVFTTAAACGCCK